MTVWRKNLFQLPKGRHGKEFINEMTKQIDLWCSNSPFRNISMKCLMIMPNLLLQRTSNKTSSADNKATLERRLSLWRDKKIAVLIGECLVIQSRLKSSKHPSTKEDIAKSFNNFMITGRINAALRLLSKTDGNGILPLDNNTIAELHLPEANPFQDDILIQGPIKFLSPVIYDEITEDTILKAVSRTKGAGGVSCWMQMNGDEY